MKKIEVSCISAKTHNAAWNGPLPFLAFLAASRLGVKLFCFQRLFRSFKERRVVSFQAIFRDRFGPVSAGAGP